MARGDPTIYMKIPADLKDLLEASSAANRRSMTAEVVARLQGSFGPVSDPSMPTVQATILQNRVESLEVIAEAYKATAEAASTTALVLLEKLEELANELPRNNRLAHQSLVLIEAMRTKNSASLPINNDRFEDDGRHHREHPPRKTSSGKK